MPLPVPPLNDDLSLRYYTTEELAQIDLQQIGVEGEGDHFQEEFGPDGAGCTRRYSCVWEERFAAVLVLVGYAKSFTDEDDVVRISRLLPDCHPARPEFNWACTKVRVDPFQYTGEIDEDVEFGQVLPEFSRAKMDAVYEHVPFALIDDEFVDAEHEYTRYVTIPGRPGAEITAQSNYISMAGGCQSYVTDDGTTRPAGVPVPFNIGYPETLTTKKIPWRRVPENLWGEGTILQTRVKGDGTPSNRGMIGSLNLTEFFGHPPLTLMLLSVEERALPDPIGVGFAWDLVYVFQEKNVPFGHTGFIFFDAPPPGVVRPAKYYQALAANSTTTKAAADIADGDALFNVREFANLFIVGAV